MKHKKILMVLSMLAIIFLCSATPVKASDRIWDPYDHKLIYNEKEWNCFNTGAKFNYLCSYIEFINNILGLQGTERVTKSQVHIMEMTDPMYFKTGCAYTERNNNIYLNMEKLGCDGIGAGYALIVLAHEMKHVEQNLHGRIDWVSANSIDYDVTNFSKEAYSSQPHEIEASQFGLNIPKYLKIHWDEMRANGVVFDD